VAVAATVPGLLLSTVLSRYRAPLTALLLPLAGAGAARLGTWALAWRWRRLGVAAAGTALYLAWAASSPPGQAPAERGTRYAWAGVGALANGQPAYATLLLRASLRLEPGAARVRARLAQALLSSGATAEALVEVEAAGRSFDSAALRELHAQALAAAGRVREAIAEAQAARALDPARASARDLLEALQNGPRQAATPGAGKEPSP
jgi:tetratricopeptide (TPR) repeat protein